MYQKTKLEIDLERHFTDPKSVAGLKVVMFMKGAKNPPRLRIARILELLKSRARLIESAPECLPVWTKILESSEATVLSQSSSPVYQLNNEIDQLLARYKPPPLRMGMPTRSGQLLRSVFEIWAGEAEVAQTLKTIADYEPAILDRIRTCRGCGDWLYAFRADQVNCDAGCRHINYAQSDFYKRRARLQSKVNYYLAKSRFSESPAGKAKADVKLQLAKAELGKLKGETK